MIVKSSMAYVTSSALIGMLIRGCLAGLRPLSSAPWSAARSCARRLRSCKASCPGAHTHLHTLGGFPLGASGFYTWRAWKGAWEATAAQVTMTSPMPCCASTAAKATARAAHHRSSRSAARRDNCNRICLQDAGAAGRGPHSQPHVRHTADATRLAGAGRRTACRGPLVWCGVLTAKLAYRSASE